MLIDELDKAVRATITNWTEEMKRDFKAVISLAQIGSEQNAFTKWMIECIKINGKKAWWNPMCLFRSYNLRGKDPGKEMSNQIRAEIRAATEAPCPFRSGAWNREYNKKIFAEWIKSNQTIVKEALKKNEEITRPQNYSSHQQSNLFPEEVVITSKEKFYEGSVKEITVNAYERDPEARQRCIDFHGLNCIACGFNFEKKYGELGKGFIHVHHLRPLSDIGEKYEIDPENDLCPICPNCHGMIHKKKPPYSIKEIKQMIRS